MMATSKLWLKPFWHNFGSMIGFIYHLFCYCPRVACFWSQVQESLKMHSIDLKLTLEIVLLGDLERPDQSITNILILIVKVLIFNSQSVDSIQLDSLKLYVKHHSIVV